MDLSGRPAWCFWGRVARYSASLAPCRFFCGSGAVVCRGRFPSWDGFARCSGVPSRPGGGPWFGILGGLSFLGRAARGRRVVRARGLSRRPARCVRGPFAASGSAFPQAGSRRGPVRRSVRRGVCHGSRPGAARRLRGGLLGARPLGRARPFRCILAHVWAKIRLLSCVWGIQHHATQCLDSCGGCRVAPPFTPSLLLRLSICVLSMCSWRWL